VTVAVTAELTKTFCACIEQGGTVGDAASAVGIGRRTAERWIKFGESDRAEYVPFALAVAKAHAVRKARWVGLVDAAAAADWKAAAWLLERMHPDDFGKGVRTAVEEEIRKFLDTLRSRVNGDTWREMMHVLGEANAPGGAGVPAIARRGDEPH